MNKDEFDAGVDMFLAMRQGDQGFIAFQDVLSGYRKKSPNLEKSPFRFFLKYSEAVRVWLDPHIHFS